MLLVLAFWIFSSEFWRLGLHFFRKIFSWIEILFFEKNHEKLTNEFNFVFFKTKEKTSGNEKKYESKEIQPGSRYSAIVIKTK